ncbi:30S ribosomal protein S6 [Chloroflexota bacterium]
MATKKKTVVETRIETVHSFELIVIISPELDEAGLESRIENITQFVNSHGGTVAGVDHWGRKKLAYPIERHLEGYYILVAFQMNTAACAELGDSLNITEDVLRHMLVRQDE